MYLKNAVITGVQGWAPEKVLSNKDLEKMVDTNDEWIRSRTGIEERRLLEDGQGTLFMAKNAVSELLKKTNTAPEEVELVVFGTITPDYKMPDTGTLLCNELGLVNAYGFDLRAACSGFLYSLTVGAQFIQTGLHKKVIVIGGDKMSSIIDYEDRATCIIFGDGCGAVMLEPSEEPLGFKDAILRGDGSGAEYLTMKAGGAVNPITPEALANKEHLVYQNGRPVFKAAVKNMSGTVKELLERNNLTNDDIDWVLPHQANIRIITSVAEALDFPMEKVMVNIQKYGNTTAGTLPLCLWEYEDKLKKGDKIVLTAFGGGFTWGAILLEWGYDGANA